MKVAMIVVNQFTHDGRVQKEARALTENGYEVEVFALHGKGLPESEIYDGYQVRRIRVRSRGWGTHLLVRMVKYVEFCTRAIVCLVQARPTIVHAHDVNALIPAYIATRLIRSSLIYDAHELWIDRRRTLLRSSAVRRFLGVMEGVLARRADAVITVNPSIAQILADQHSLSQPTVLMHCQRYRDLERNDSLRSEFGIAPDRRIVIYAGRFLPGRGLDKLIEAAHYLDRSVVVLMGPDHMNGKLQHLVAENSLQDRVFIRDPVAPDQVPHYVASADIGVITTQSVDMSYHYSAGNKLFHYLMAGLPSAVSNQPEKRRLIETYEVGAVFDQTDPQDIARVINQLLNDEETYQSMSRAAKRVSRETLNWQTESQKLLRLYERILDT